MPYLTLFSIYSIARSNSFPLRFYAKRIFAARTFRYPRDVGDRRTYSHRQLLMTAFKQPPVFADLIRPDAFASIMALAKFTLALMEHLLSVKFGKDALHAWFLRGCPSPRCWP